MVTRECEVEISSLCGWTQRCCLRTCKDDQMGLFQIPDLNVLGSRKPHTLDHFCLRTLTTLFGTIQWAKGRTLSPSFVMTIYTCRQFTVSNTSGLHNHEKTHEDMGGKKSNSTKKGKRNLNVLLWRNTVTTALLPEYNVLLLCLWSTVVGEEINSINGATLFKMTIAKWWGIWKGHKWHQGDAQWLRVRDWNRSINRRMFKSC